MNELVDLPLFSWHADTELVTERCTDDSEVVITQEMVADDCDASSAIALASGCISELDGGNADRRIAPPPVTIDAEFASPAVTSPLPATVCARLPKSFSEALHLIHEQGLFEPERMRRLLSDIGVAAKMTLTTVEQLPCDPVLLRPMLRRVLPARFRIRPKRWSSIKSSLGRVMKITGWLEADDVLQAPLTSEWQAGCDLLPNCPQKAVFAHFARFCQRSGIRPADVTAQTLEAYGDWKTNRTLELDISHHVSATRRLWNSIVGHHSAWPQRCLQRPRPAGAYGLCLDELHPSLRADIEQCCTSMAQFSPLSSRNARVYSPRTIFCSRGILLRAAGVLVQSGAACGSLESLHDILNPAAIRRVLEDHAERVGKGVAWAASSATVAITLKRMARISGALSEAEMVEVDRLCGMVKAPPPRLKATARGRLAQFDEPPVLRRFLRLATSCFETADWMLRHAKEHRGASETKAARLHQKALALLVDKPLRREDLAELDLATDFRRDSKGRIVGLCIPGRKTKTGQAEEAIFEAPLIRRIDRHLRIFRPLLCEGESTYLFPGRINGHRSSSNIAFELKRLVQNEIGAEFNVHLVRHLAVSMLLDDNPRNMPVAQRLIGHTQVKTTERFYGEARTRGAQREWSRVLQRKMTQFERKVRA